MSTNFQDFYEREKKRQQSSGFAEFYEKEQQRVREQQELARTTEAAVEQSGDEYAAAMRAGELTGVSPEVARQDMAEARRQTRMREIEQGLQRSPALQSYFRNNPAALTVAQDDIDVLAEVGEFINELKFTTSVATLGLVGGLTSTAAAGFRRFGPTETIGRGMDLMAEDIQALQETLRGEQENLSDIERIALGGLESVPASLLAGGISVATGGAGAPVGLAILGASSGGQARTRALREGVSEPRATVAGGAEGVLEAFWERIPLGKLTEDVLNNASFRRLFFRQLASEGLTEQGATFTQDLAEQVILEPDKPIGEFFDLQERSRAAYETLIATLVATTVSSGTMGVATHGMRRQQQADVATNAAETLTKLDTALKNSKLRGRSPQVLSELVQHLGGQDLRIDAAKLVEVLEARDVDIDALRQQMPSLNEQLDDALALNGEVQIPASEWAANLAGQEFNQELIPEYRIGNNELSATEAQAQSEQQTEQLATEAQAALEDDTAAAEIRLQRADIEGQIASQLTTARPDLYTPETATQTATAFGQLYQRAAEREGVSPQELFRRFPVRIEAAEGAATAQELEQRVFQGTIAERFDEFSLDFVGSGEGAAAFGFGLYFSESRGIAEFYREALGGQEQASVLVGGKEVEAGVLTPEDIAQTVLQRWQQLVREPAEAVRRAKRDLQSRPDISQRNSRALELLEQWEQEGITFQQRGAVIEAELAPTEEELLRWDVPLAEQNERVLEPLFNDPAVLRLIENSDLNVMTGEGLYRGLERALGSDEAASRHLDALGVKGIRYPAGTISGTADVTVLVDGQEVDTSGKLETAATALLQQHRTPDAAIRHIEQRQQGGQFFTRGESNRDLTALLTQWKDLGVEVRPKTFNFVVFDPKAVDIVEFAQGQRGAIRFGDESGEAVIRLRDAADLSTALHEGGHLFLEIYSQLATRPDAPQSIVNDMQGLMDWFGVENVEAFNAMSVEERRPFHEQFAEGFETYLFQGRAPAEGLRPLFRVFKGWFKQVYKALKNMRVPLTPEVTAIMDRMFAASDKIDIAEAQHLARPLIEQRDQANLTDAEWQEYQDLQLEATEQAHENLERRSLRDMKWLRNFRTKELKRLQKETRAAREALRERAEREVQNRPERVAEAFLKTGEFSLEGDNSSFETHKLDRAALERMYAPLEETDTPIPNWRNLRSGRNTLTQDDGLHPDDVARMVGLEDGFQLVERLDGLAPIAEDIEAHLDHLMLEEHADLATPEALERAVDQAVHNDARIKLVALELKALGAAVKPQELMRAARRLTDRAVGRKAVGRLRLRDFQLAEARSAKQADDALQKGDLVLAATHKRNQILNMMAARRASLALDQIKKDLQYIQKYRKARLKETIGRDTVEQIEGLLERYRFREPTETERPSLQGWLAEQLGNGFDSVLPDWVHTANPRAYTDLTVEQFGELMDGLKSVEEIGRARQKMLTARKAMSLAEAAETASTTIRDNAGKPIPQGLTPPSGVIQKGKALLLQNRYFDSLVREFDGWTEGPIWELLARSKNEATDFKTQRLGQAFTELRNIFAPLGSLNERVRIPEINMTLTLAERIGIALHTGNQGNLQRLQDGGLYSGPDKLSPDDVRAVLNTLTKEQMDAVQKVWDLNESFWPEIEAREKRLKGYAPKRVEPTPIETRHGTYRGGYFPISFDSRSVKPGKRAETEQDLFNNLLGGRFASAVTSHGHTKERAAEVKGVPLNVNIQQIPRHIQTVVHDLAFHEWVSDAHRLLSHQSVAGAIREHYGEHVLNQLRNDVRTYALGEMQATSVLDSFARYVRKGAAIHTLAFSFQTAMLQPLGLMQAVPRLGSKDGKPSAIRGAAWLASGMAKNFGSIAAANRAVHYIRERSPFMVERQGTFIRALTEFRDQIDIGHPVKRTVRSVHNKMVNDAGFAMIRMSQGMTDNIIWLAAESKAASEGADPDTAARIADQAVRDTQGSGLLTDRTALENQQWGQLLTLYGTFFFRTYNMMLEVKGQTRTAGDAVNAAALFGTFVTLPAVLGQLLWVLTRADEPEDELELKDFADEQLAFLLNTLPIAREFSGAVQGFDYRGPAAFRFFSAGSTLIEQSKQGEFDEAWWGAFADTAGIGLQLPGAQADRTVSGVLEYLDENENPEQIIFGPKVNTN